MRPWEAIDKDDLEKKYGKRDKEEWMKLHAELSSTSIKLANGNMFEESDEIDNELIAIETMLETEHDIKWDGESFQ